ncbi:MAG: hypothetical protein P9L94_02090 [Candidatus Hinthialibacter antarcticus]|nr:hypothetical protein [Candidatus Hinthialibacter antarcticus]
MLQRKSSFLVFAFALLIATPAFAQLGAFDVSTDIGDVGAAGSAEAVNTGPGDFDAAVYEYEIQASGADIWGTADEFHYVYMEAEGDFKIFGRVDLNNGPGASDWAKAGLMVRNNLTPGSAFAFGLIRTNLDYMAQWRDEQDTDANSSGDDLILPAAQMQEFFAEGATYTMALERRGNTFNYYYISAETGEEILHETHVVPDMQDPVYVGMAVTSHEDGQIATGYFQNVGIAFRSFNTYETFSYLDESEGTGLDAIAVGGGPGWASEWTASGANSPSALSTTILEAGLVVNQPSPELNTGGYSVEIAGDAGDGVSRMLGEVENAGDIWISFVYQETGPAADHWSGMTLYDSEGGESSFIGKPFNSEFCGIGNLSDADSLTDIDYTVPNHFLVRIDMDPTPGQNDSVYLWVNPDETDRLDTYLAGGPGNDDILDIAELRLRRGGAAGSSFFDNIWISSDAALPPAGAGRVDLTFNNPDRDPAIPVWDVISLDKYEDGITGVVGFGHDQGNDHYLVVSGYIYDDNTNIFVANGLPPDRMSGLNGHVFGPYNNAALEQGLKNSVKFMLNDTQRGPFTFDVVPPGNYRELRMSATVGNGFGELITTLNFDDGSSEETALHADDWFRDPADSSWQYADVRQLIDGMDRLGGGESNFQNSNDPSVNEDKAPVNPDKVLVSVTLELADPPRSASNPGFNLYDIWALPADSGTPVMDWALY